MNDNIEIRVWWVPQIPGDSFRYTVPSLAAAKLLVDALARYDLFQLDHGVRPDFDNAGGASWRHPVLTGGEWQDFDPEDDEELAEVERAMAGAAGR